MTLVLAAAVAVFFLGMGVIALAAPERIWAIFDQTVLSPAARNEIRAVYGGFGVAIALVLTLALREPALRPGVFLGVGMALGGMAAGRVVSACIERPPGFYPSWFYCLLETLMALVLLAARTV
jgi:hypothetical protein